MKNTLKNCSLEINQMKRFELILNKIINFMKIFFIFFNPLNTFNRELIASQHFSIFFLPPWLLKVT